MDKQENPISFNPQDSSFIKGENNRVMASASDPAAEFSRKIKARKAQMGRVTDPVPTGSSALSKEKDEYGVMETVGNNLMAVGAGALDAVDATVNLALDAADAAANLVGGDIDDDFRSDMGGAFLDESLPWHQGGVVRAISSFLVPFAGLSKVSNGIKAVSALKGMGKMGKFAHSSLIGGAVDFIAMDPDEGRLADVAQQTGMLPEFASFLASEEDDNFLEGRLKNMTEGLILGGVTEGLAIGFGKGLKAYRGKRVAKKVLKEADRLAEAKKLAGEGATEGTDNIAKKPLTKEEALSDFEVDTKLKNEAEVKKMKKAEKIELEANVEKARKLYDRAMFQTKDVKLRLLPKVTMADDFSMLLKDHMASDDWVKQSKRAPMTMDGIKKGAKELGLDPDFMLARTENGVYNAEQVFAAFDIIKKTGKELKEVAKVTARSNDKGDEAALAVAMSAYSNLLTSFNGAGSEMGRAFRSLRELKEKGYEQIFNTIDEVVHLAGGSADLKKMARNIERANEKQIARAMRKTSTGKKFSDALIEMRTAGLLSGAATHAVNIASNASVIGSNIVERGVASGISLLRGDIGVAGSEAKAMIHGLTAGMGDAFKVAWDSFKTGDSVFGHSSKLEVVKNKSGAISSEALEIEGKVAAKAINGIGKFIRSPFNALQGADSFFKQLHYSMEVHAQAARKVDTMGIHFRAKGTELDPKIAKELYQEAISNPDNTIDMLARESADYNTFNRTNELSRSIIQFRDKLPLGRVIAPFINTNVNLMQFAIERTPMAFMLGEVRTALKAGGAQADMAMSKIATGSGFMVAGMSLVANNTVTGGGPSNLEARKMLEATGWKPYSLKIGDEYYEYKRIEPFGKILGMTANLYESLGSESSEDQSALSNIMISTAASLGHLFNPEFLSRNIVSVHEMVNNPGGKSTAHFISGQVASFTPFSGALRTVRKGVDPAKRDTLTQEQNGAIDYLDTIANKFKNNIPGYSDDLAPQRNIFGDVVVYAPGVMSRSVSPFAASKKKDGPIHKEVRALGLDKPFSSDLNEDEKFLVLGQMDRSVTLFGKKERLNNQQFSELQKLAGGHGLKGIPDTLEQSLNKIVKNSFYNKLPRESKISLIRSRVKFYRDAAKAQFLMANPEISKEILQRKKRTLGL